MQVLQHKTIRQVHGDTLRKILWSLAIFWPLTLAFVVAAELHFVLSERWASIDGIVIVVGAAFANQSWVRYFDRSGGSERLMRRLKLEPRDLFRPGR